MTDNNTHVLQVKGNEGEHLDLWKFENPNEAQDALKAHQNKFPHHEARLVSRTVSTEDKVLPSVVSSNPAPKKTTAKPTAKSAVKKSTPAAKPTAKPVAKKSAPAKKVAPKKAK
jgi:hypothetical protein